MKSKRISENIRNQISENIGKAEGQISENLRYKVPADFEAGQNLIGAFGLLLEIDRRVNPQNYGLNNNQNENA